MFFLTAGEQSATLNTGDIAFQFIAFLMILAIPLGILVFVYKKRNSSLKRVEEKVDKLFSEKDNKSNVGFTLFKPTGVKHEFPMVDLKNQQVTGTVSYNDKVYMTVVVDLKTDTVNIEGSVEELKGISMDTESYIRMFKSQAEFFVQNNISNPKKYFEQFK